ncbi:hypothetical protein [Acidithiobacillus sulfuriphilus]|uniref:hypothetical protein n=1 Tax=Acidithiobacillus sulfuriphilus TaxID=1867749 RepID=UPI003F60CC22
MSAVFGLLLAAASLSAVPDPTRPNYYTAASVAEGPLVLDSTLRGGPVPLAILNGRLLRPGEKIGPYQLMVVGSGWVMLRNGAKTLRLVIGGSTPEGGAK